MSDRAPWGSACTTDAVSAAIEQLEFDLGEGPGADAHHRDQPVLEPDLADPAASRRLVFTAAALGAGARGAVFGLPLRVGAARLCSLDLFRAQRHAAG